MEDLKLKDLNLSLEESRDIISHEKEVLVVINVNKTMNY